MENRQLNDRFKVGINIVVVGLGEVTSVKIGKNVVRFDKVQHDVEVNDLFKNMLPPVYN